MVSPDSTFFYRDSRGICERIAREAPSFLAAGGILQMVCNWPCHRGRDWKDDLSAWFRKSVCDVWVLQTDHLAPASYAGIWLGQAHDDSADLGPELERWMAFYDEAGIEAVGGGVVAMRRRAPRGLDTRPWFEIRDMPPANGPSGETIPPAPPSPASWTAHVVLVKPSQRLPRRSASRPRSFRPHRRNRLASTTSQCPSVPASR